METMGRRIRTEKRSTGMLAVGGSGPGPPRPRGACKELTIYDLRPVRRSLGGGGLTITNSFTTAHATLFEGEG